MSEHEERGVQDDASNPEHDDLFLDPDDGGEDVANDVIVLSVSEVEEAERALESDDPVIAATGAAEAVASSEALDAAREEVDRLRGELERAEAAEAEALSQVGQLRQEVERVRGERDEAKDERDDLKSRLLRRVADHDNYRKRVEREKADLRKYASEPLVRDLLQAVDNLERALDHAERANDANSILQGVKMVYRQMIGFFERHGIKGFDAEGEMFDPQLHEAMQQIPTPDHETNTILQVYQKGYFMHDRLIRAARVVVALHQAPPQPEPEEVEAEEIEFEEIELEEVPAEEAETQSEESEVIGMPGPDAPLDPSEAEDADAPGEEEPEPAEDDAAPEESVDEGVALDAQDAGAAEVVAEDEPAADEGEPKAPGDDFSSEPTKRIDAVPESRGDARPKLDLQSLGRAQSEASGTHQAPEADAGATEDGEADVSPADDGSAEAE